MTSSLSLPPNVVLEEAQSRQFFGNGIAIEQHRQPPQETGLHVLPHHVIAVHTGRVLHVEGIAAGRRFSHTAVPGDISILPAGLDKLETWTETAEYLVLRIDSQKLEREPDLHLVVKSKDFLIYEICKRLVVELNTGFDKDELYIEALTGLAVTHITHHYSNQQESPLHISANAKVEIGLVIEYINDKLSEKLTLIQLANHIGFSLHHFVRVFKRTTGQTPWQYILNLRVERATYYLVHTTMPLSEIAQLSGFSNHSQFSKHFKRRRGMTPSKFRQISQD